MYYAIKQTPAQRYTLEIADTDGEQPKTVLLSLR